MEKISLHKRLCRKAMCAIFAASALLAVQNVQADNSLMLGNGRNVVVTQKQVQGETNGSALFFDKEYMSAYKGCTISEINVSIIARSSTGNTLRLFLTHDLNGEPVYETTLTTWKAGWNKVTLETPYVIDGEALYLGYEVTGTKFVSYCEQFVENEEWIKSDEAGWKKFEEPYSAAIYAKITGADLPLNNARLGTVIQPKYASVGDNINYTCDIYNLGATNITDVTATYLINGKESGTEKIEGLNLKPRSKTDISFNGPKLTEEGDFEMAIRITGINGGTDAVMSDNTSANKTVICRNNFTKRKVLMEMFSTEKCSNCPGTHTAIEKALSGRKDYVELSHHVGYYTDKFTIPESEEYLVFYPKRGTFAPAMMFDRTNFYEEHPSVYRDNVPVIGAGGPQAAMLVDYCLQTPAFATVNIEAEADQTTRKTNIKVKGSRLIPTESSANTMLYVYLTEDGIFTADQAGASGDYTQNHVARKSLTPAWGTPVDLDKGYEESFSVEIPEEWDFLKINVVAFVAHYNPEDKNDCKVLNAENTYLRSCLTGIMGVETDNDDKPADVYTTSGVRVLHNATKADIENLAKGIYIINGKKFVVTGK